MSVELGEVQCVPRTIHLELCNVSPELSLAVLVRRDGELFIRMYNRDAQLRWIPYAEVRTPDPTKPYLRSPRRCRTGILPGEGLKQAMADAR